ncbi:hypothetical protein BDZ97DRAFT_1905402 [Flammula alnicola]|nr:hypothetical protein BDZ97DRAFT_1905402 [Flammula alnicola]
MFGGGTSTEYEDIVNKTTDENLTSENWELILNLCDKVQDEGQPGAHAAIAAILKRLAHRNPNVQLYALSLTEALSKNVGIEIHRELASRAFTQGLEKLITDRNTHEKVRRRALGLIALWAAEFEKDETLGIMEDCYNNLEAKNYKFEQPQETPPPNVDDEIRRKEEEELQRVLEMSMQDKGGRSQWSDSSHPFAQPKYAGGGYVPARTPSPKGWLRNNVSTAAIPRSAAQHRNNSTTSVTDISTPTVTVAPAPAPTSSSPPATSMSANGNIVTRVRALHTFEPTEPGELAFEKGDIIKRSLKGRTGIFPVNYVEAMPEPTAAELAKEAEQEAAVFAQAVNVEKLLNIRSRVNERNLRSCANYLRQDDGREFGETLRRYALIFIFLTIYRIALNAIVVYDQPTFRPSQYVQGRPDSRGAAGRRSEYGPTGYGAYPSPANAYGMPGPQPGPEMLGGTYPAPGPGQPGLGPQQPGQQQQQQGGYVDPAAGAAYGGIPPQGQQQQQVPGGYGVVPQGGYAGHQPGVPYTQQGPTPYPAQQQQSQPQQQPVQQQPIQQQPIQQQPIQQQPIQQQPIQQQPIQAQSIQQQQPQPVQQVHPQQIPQQQQQPIQVQTEAIQATLSAAQPQPQPQVQAEPQPQPQPQAQPQPQQPISGPPPYVYNPSYTYADPNVQAWAQYYAQGGKDLAGSVYFQRQPEGYGAQHHQQQQQQQQGLGRQQSLQAQVQPQAAHVQVQPAESDLPYAAATAVRAASPAQQQPQQQPISYQLQDQAQPQIQPQYATQYQPSHADLAPKQSSPSSPSYGGARPGSGGYSSSPTQSSSTPSWVLPKKTGPAGSATSVHGPGPAGGEAYFPVTNQMGGLTLTDPAVAVLSLVKLDRWVFCAVDVSYSCRLMH